MKVTWIFGFLLVLVAFTVAQRAPTLTEDQEANLEDLLSVDEQGHENVADRTARQWGGGGRGGFGGGGRGGFGGGGRGGGWGGGGGGGWGGGGGGGWGGGGGGGWGR
ncbi:protein FAM98B-like [Hermetia illucens]|uniref:protein FAM98B-like n=1 Tax=Hermetia illucens TaxID=343691 RepID=UPI0018CC3517|nr:protein FAM98B-like [Hermetia illucens]